MVATIMLSSDEAKKAEVYLGTLGVVRVLPDLWEMVAFEATTLPGRWDYRRLTRRYLEYLRDRASSVRRGEGDN